MSVKKVPMRKKRVFKKKPVLKPARDQAVRKIVKQVLHSQAENKLQIWNNSGVDIYPYNYLGSGANVNTVPLTPDASYMTITQGVTQEQRVGNSIRVVKNRVKMVIFPNPYNATTNPTPRPSNVQVLIYSMKPAVDSLANARTVVLNTFFNNGDGSAGFTSNLADYTFPINDEVVTIHYSRIFKLGISNITTGDSGHQGANIQNNNDYSFNILLDLDVIKWTTKNIKWNDASTTPTTRGLYMSVYDMFADGEAPVATQLRNTFYYTQTLEYEDL